MSSAQYNATPPTVADGKGVALQTDTRGNVKFALANGDGTTLATLGSDNADAAAATSAAQRLVVSARSWIFNGTTFDREVKATSTARLLSAAATTNATNVKASAGNLFRLTGVNANVAARYLKLYNKASAPTVGTDTPVWTFYLPPSTVGGGVFNLDFGSMPLYFALGIGYALTTLAADADATAVTAADIIAMNLAYS